MWTEQEAREKLEDLLRRADAGEPQFIAGPQPCVILSLAEYERMIFRNSSPRLGKWLVENAPRIGDIELPPRHSDRPVPFEDWSEEELTT